MKQNYFLLIALFIFAFSNAQAPAIQWQKTLGGTGEDYAHSIQPTPDGGYIVAGYTDSTDGDVTGNHGGPDYWVVKLNPSGTIQWQKTLGGTGYDYAWSIQPTTDGGYIVAGYTTSTDGDVTGNHGGNDYWVVKLNPSGTIQWQKTLGGTGDDGAYSIQPTPDGGYIVAGATTSTDGDVTGNHGGNDYWVVKLNPSGTIEWQKTLGGTGYDEARSIQPTTDGGYIVAGRTYSIDGDVTGNHGGGDYWVVKLNPSGTIQWQKTLGGTGNDYAWSIQPTTDGGYIVAGSTYSNDGDVTGYQGSFDYWVVKLNPSGTIEWQKTLGGTGSDVAHSIQPTTDGGYIVAGRTYSTNGDVTGNHGSYDYWVVKLNPSGTIQWQKTIGGTGEDNAYSIQPTTDGGYIVAGYTWSTDGDVTGNHGGSDSWVVKLNPSGAIQWQKTIGGTGGDLAYSIQPTTDGGYIVAGITASNDGDVTGNQGGGDYWVVKLGPDGLATSGFVKNNINTYPNPACTILNLQVANNTSINKIIITDLTGKIVKEQTQNTTTINVENLAQGMYILEAYSGEQKMVSKFVKE